MNVGDLGKLIVAKGFKKLPKVQKIATSGHTDCSKQNFFQLITTHYISCAVANLINILHSEIATLEAYLTWKYPILQP